MSQLCPGLCLSKGGLQKLTCIPADLEYDSDAAKRTHYGELCRRLHWVKLAPCMSTLRYGIFHYQLICMVMRQVQGHDEAALTLICSTST